MRHVLLFVTCLCLWNTHGVAGYRGRRRVNRFLSLASSAKSTVFKKLDTSRTSLVFNTRYSAANFGSASELKVDPVTGLVDDLVYISDPGTAKQLGCGIDHEFACFYRFDDSAEELAPWTNGSMSLEKCEMVFKPLDPDRGRPWCIRKGKYSDWLGDLKTWTIPGAVMQLGSLDGPNPTHQANLHFLHIWRWMRKAAILPGQLQLVCDSANKDFTPGKFGEGLANALGRIEWLQHLPHGAIAFKHIRFSIPDVPSFRGSRFPFALSNTEINMAADAQYVELAENVKLQLSKRFLGKKFNLASWSSKGYKSPPLVKSRPEMHAVVSKRHSTDTRHWTNAEDLVLELKKLDLTATLVTMGSLPFDEQVKLVSSADVLVGVHGSDLVNLMFLPIGGSMVEVFPKMDGRGYFNPELQNMAHLLAKGHFLHISNGPVDIDLTTERQASKVLSMNVSSADLAPLVHLAAFQAKQGFQVNRISCKYSADFVEVICAES